jgi:hypothetical protein
LLDLKTMDRFTFATGTTGGRIAIGELRDKLVWMRRVRGPNVYPVVTLGDVFMKTRYGGRQRPHFQIVRWVRLGGEGAGEAAALPAPAQPVAADSPPLVPGPTEDLNDSVSDIGCEEVSEPVKPPKVVKVGAKKKVA